MRSIADIPITASETVGRFALKPKWRRQTNAGIRASFDAFLPYSHVELSVTRTRNLSEHRKWGSGICAYTKRAKNDAGTLGLYGVFILAVEKVPKSLRIVPSEGPKKGPLNHMNIVEYPEKKSEQMVLARMMAEDAEFIEVPAHYHRHRQSLPRTQPPASPANFGDDSATSPLA